MPKQKGIFAILSKTEKENLKKNNERYAKEIANYCQWFNLLHDLMRNIAEAKKELRLSDVTIFVVCNRIIGTSKAFLDLQMKGYKYDANIIMRSLIESVSLLNFLIKDEKNANKWLDGNLKFKDIRKALGLSSDKEFAQTYASFSDYVHSNFGALASLFEIDGREIPDKEGMIKGITTFIIEPDTEKSDPEKYSLFPSAGIRAIWLLQEKYGSLVKPQIKSQIKGMLGTLK